MKIDQKPPKIQKGKKKQIRLQKPSKMSIINRDAENSIFSHIKSVTLTYLILFLTKKDKFSFLIFFFCLNLQRIHKFKCNIVLLPGTSTIDMLAL